MEGESDTDIKEPQAAAHTPEGSAPPDIETSIELGSVAFDLATRTPRELAGRRQELLERGAAADDLVEHLSSDQASVQVGELVKGGASAEAIITAIGRGWVERGGLSKLLEAGVSPDELLPSLTIRERALQAPLLSEHGLSLEEITEGFTTGDVITALPVLAASRTSLDGLFERCEPRAIAGHLDVFVDAGIPIDFEKYLPLLTREDVGQNLEVLIQAGAPLNKLVEKLDPWDLDESCDRVLAAGADPMLVLERLARRRVGRHLTELSEAGAPVDALMQRLDAWDVREHLEELHELGADPETTGPLIAAARLSAPQDTTVWL